MNKADLILFFTTLGKGYYKPNSGGCGLFAYAASRALDSIGIEHKIKVCCWGKWQYKEFADVYGEAKRGNVNLQYLKFIKYQIGRGIHNHIVIEIDGVFYDASGIDTFDRAPICLDIDIKTLRLLVQVKDKWNSTFWFGNDDHKTEIGYVARRAEKLSMALKNKTINAYSKIA